MQRTCHDVSVQTDAGSRVEQYTQVNVDQTTEWTQCIVSHSDQSVQTVYKQSPASVQVAPETSDAVVQTLTVVAEPAERLSSVMNEDKLISESEISGHCQAEQGSFKHCIVASDVDREIASSSLAAEPVIEIIEDSPHYSDSASSSQQLQQQADHNYCTLATSANFICEKSETIATQTSVTPPTVSATIAIAKRDTVAAQNPVTSAIISAIIDELPNQYDADEISQVPAVVQNQFPPPTVSGTWRPAVLQPSFRMSTGTKYIYSLEKQTLLASSLILQQCSEITSVCYSGSQAASIQNIPIQQLVHEMPLLSNTPALVTQCAVQTSACPALNAKPSFEVYTTKSTNAVESSSEMSSSRATVTDAPAALKPLLPILDAGEPCLPSSDSNQPSTNLQQNTFTLRIDNSSSKSQAAVGQDIITKKLDSCASPPSVPLPNDLIQNAPSPTTEACDESASVNYSSRLTTHLEESVVSESDQQCIHSATQSTADTEDDDIILLEYNSGEFPGHAQNEKVWECENVTRQQCDQSGAGENQSTRYTCTQNNRVSCESSIDVTAACSESTATTEQYVNKEQKAKVQAEMDNNVARFGDCTRGRGRRPLFVCRGPLMETVSMSPRRKLAKDFDSRNRKLPVMLLGMYVLIIST